MMMNTHFSLTADNFKNILSKYFEFDISSFTAYIGRNDLDDVLVVASDEIRMSFTADQIKEVLNDLFNKGEDDIIDNIHVTIIRNTTRDRKYISINCDITKECLKSIVDMISSC